MGGHRVRDFVGASRVLKFNYWGFGGARGFSINIRVCEIEGFDVF